MNYSFFAAESTKSIECIENANCIKTTLSTLLYIPYPLDLLYPLYLSLPFSTLFYSLYLLYSLYFPYPLISNLLSSEPHFEAQDRSQNHLNILQERVVFVVILVQSHLIRVYYIVVVPYS